MSLEIQGTIISSNISEMGKMRYGYLGIETDEKEHLKIKVTAFTKYDTLDLGEKVTIELESIGTEKVMNAKKITLAK
ncbi:MAG: hypothetical protein JW779_06645 [Candidatus Thorarchaeota archaeon]|nr:hypothetical protein [Candidatus Thorarchaeota archaeon]